MTAEEKRTMIHDAKNPVPKRPRRRGTATVEFAVVAIFLMTLMLGVVEVTRAIQVKNTLTDIARSGCRVGTVPGNYSQQVTDNVNTILTNNGITSSLATTAILVNSKSADVSTAKKGDQISVKISITISAVNWVSPLFLSSTAIESETVIMMHQ
jgi:Flp pilus assembly protein TadG